MIDAHPLENALGMELYSTDFPGLGGKLKTRFEDFLVEEISIDRQTINVHEWSESVETSRMVEGKSDRFVTFAVQKMGLSTMDVANILASSLGISRNYVSYAGLKDKRAITTQLMSIPSSAVDLLRSVELSRVDIRGISYTRHPIQVGDLWGNRFTILLRDINADCDSATSAVNQIKKQPLLNYFGVQRFGLTRPNTHLVGKALIKRDFEGSVRAMLCTLSEFESEELRNVRLRLSEDITPTEKIIDTFPDDLGYEKTVMKELMKHPGDYERAISKVPPRVLTLQVHAYQSYIFNRLLSLRTKSGISIQYPTVGDFIIKLDEAHSGRDTWLYVTETTLDRRLAQVDSGEYALALPIPGYSTRLPPVKQSDLLIQILKEENTLLRDFRNSTMKSLNSPGGLHLASINLQDLKVSCSEKGLLTSFSLRKGSYATVVMREIMKNHPIHRV